MTEVPVFINCRDRVTTLLPLIDYLERAGCERIHLLDNGSTYPPLLEYYERTPHDVIRLGENRSHRSFWESGLLDELGVRGQYVFTDPDLIPIKECPLDAIEYFAEVLERYPGYPKAGFGLKIDDLPDHFRMKAEVIAWESRFWRRLVAPRIYEAPIDTTFALYRTPEYAPRHALRTGYPYLVRHTTWYLDSDNLPEEHRYYIEHARVTTWSRDEMAGGEEGPTPERTERMRAKLERAAAQPGGPAAVTPRAEAPDAPGVPQGAWAREPAPVAEAAFSPAAGPGWQAWNERSPEVEFCDFAAALVQMTRPASVLETGTGEGFVTRRVGERLGPDRRLVCFEPRSQWRAALAEVPFFDGHARVLSERERPADEDFAQAELSILHSPAPHRLEEVAAWWRTAPAGALVLVHEAGEGHGPGSPQARLAGRIRELGIPGAFLANPRGGFLGLRPERP